MLFYLEKLETMHNAIPRITSKQLPAALPEAVVKEKGVQGWYAHVFMEDAEISTASWVSGTCRAQNILLMLTVRTIQSFPQGWQVLQSNENLIFLNKNCLIILRKVPFFSIKKVISTKSALQWMYPPTIPNKSSVQVVNVRESLSNYNMTPLLRGHFWEGNQQYKRLDYQLPFYL